MSGLLRVLAAAVIVLALTGATFWYVPSSIGVVSRLQGSGNVLIERGIAYGPDERQRLDVYRPRNRGHDTETAAKPVVVFLYGGSWKSGERGTYAFVGQALAERGFPTVIPDYRLFPDVQFPAFVEDAAAAYAWAARAFEATCGSDKSQKAPSIVLVGHSAGAHMAALLTVDRSYLDAFGGIARPSGLVGLAGPYSFDPTTWPSTQAAFASVSETPDKARPVVFANGAPAAPPTLLLHGDADETVRLKNTREFEAALKATGTETKVQIYPGIGHIGIVMSIAWPLRWRAPVLDNLAAFVEKQQSPASCPKKEASAAN